MNSDKPEVKSEKIKSASLKEIREMKNNGELAKPIDNAEDLGEELPENFWSNAKVTR